MFLSYKDEIAGTTVTRTVEILCQVRMVRETLDLFGTMSVLRMATLRSTGSQDYLGFQVEIAAVQGVVLRATGAVDTAHNRIAMANRMVTLSRMGIPSKMGMGNRMVTVSKMGTTNRIHTVNRMDVQVHAHMEARVHEEDIKARGSTTALRIIMEPRHQPHHPTKGCTQYLPPSCCRITQMPTCRAFWATSSSSQPAHLPRLTPVPTRAWLPVHSVSINPCHMHMAMDSQLPYNNKPPTHPPRMICLVYIHYRFLRCITSYFFLFNIFHCRKNSSYLKYLIILILSVCGK